MKQTALVTGAASGIGHYIAIELNKIGYQVIGIDKDPATLPGTIQFYQIDLCIENNVINLFNEITHLDFAVNCAGISATRKPLIDFTSKEICTEWQKNFLPTFNTLKSEILLMQKKKKGKIINIASIAAIRGMKNFSAYGSAKASIQILTKIAAIENVEYNLKINSISPATIDTPMIRKKYQGELVDYSKTYYTGVCGTTKDIFSCVKMFIDNDFLTGYDLRIDGGLTDLCNI